MQETSPVFEKIKNLLEEKGVSYQLLEHRPVFTSEEAAKVRGTGLKQGAKAIIFFADKKPILIVVNGDKHIDVKKFKQKYNIKDLRLLKSEEIKQLTGLEIGAIPPFGNIMNLPTYMDTEVMKNKEIVFNAGSHTRSIKMRSFDFVNLCNPIIGNFRE